MRWPWGEITDCSLSFDVFPTKETTYQIDPPIEHVPIAPPFRHRIPIGSFSERCEVNLEGVFAEHGVDVQAIKGATYPPRGLIAAWAFSNGLDPEYHQHLACFPENIPLDAWAPFPDGFAILAGFMEFEGGAADGGRQRYSVEFRAKVFLFRPKLMAPMPPSYQYNVMLEPERSNYAVSCPIVHRLAPGEADRFNIKVACEMSSSHAFRIKLLVNGDRRIVSPTVRLRHFAPRTWAGKRIEQKSVSETNDPNLACVDPDVAYEGCVTASLRHAAQVTAIIAHAKQTGQFPPGRSEGGPDESGGDRPQGRRP